METAQTIKDVITHLESVTNAALTRGILFACDQETGKMYRLWSTGENACCKLSQFEDFTVADWAPEEANAHRLHIRGMALYKAKEQPSDLETLIAKIAAEDKTPEILLPIEYISSLLHYVISNTVNINNGIRSLPLSKDASCRLHVGDDIIATANQFFGGSHLHCGTLNINACAAIFDSDLFVDLYTQSLGCDLSATGMNRLCVEQTMVRVSKLFGAYDNIYDRFYKQDPNTNNTEILYEQQKNLFMSKGYAADIAHFRKNIPNINVRMYESTTPLDTVLEMPVNTVKRLSSYILE